MAKIVIDKNYFTNLPKGTHNLKVHFNDGYAEGQFTVTDKISFTILDVPFTASAGMTWNDWILSYAVSASGNGIVMYGTEVGNPKLYIDPRYANEWSWNSGGLFSDEDELFDSADTPQTGNLVIVNGMSYGRSSDAPV